MKREKLKEDLMASYSVAIDKLLAENEEIEDYAELEEAVSRLAERTLPNTLSQLQATKDFPPSVPKL